MELLVGFVEENSPTPLQLFLSHTERIVNLATADRSQLVQRGRVLEYFTVAYNSLEGLISIVAGLIAGSVSLVGFGLDSIIEVASGAALLWRLHHDRNEFRREAVERITLRVVGWGFIALAVYITCDSGLTLVRHQIPQRSIPGIVLAATSLVVMPVLARGKRRIAEGINSAAMKADGLLHLPLRNSIGWLASQRALGLDPVAGFVMVPIIAKEGIDAVRGRGCCDAGCG